MSDKQLSTRATLADNIQYIKNNINNMRANLTALENKLNEFALITAVEQTDIDKSEEIYSLTNSLWDKSFLVFAKLALHIKDR